jgi:lipocalin
MARTPQISEEDYDKMVGLVESFGYQIDRLQKAQHR